MTQSFHMQRRITNLFSAQLNLATAEQREGFGLVQRYSALGAGWQ
jgi:hypothetical protein